MPYYEQELSQLRSLSAEFARRYPKIAGRLLLDGDQCADPHTERLIESFALLASRIHKKLDDEFPQISGSFLDVLYPHYQEPMPSATIVQFETDVGKTELVRRYRIDRGETVIASTASHGKCIFRSCYAVDMLPLKLTAARLELTSSSSHLHKQAPDAAAILTLELEAFGQLSLGSLDIQSLRFFLDGDAGMMHLLYELLLSRVLRVEVGDGSAQPSAWRRLAASSIQPVGFADNEAMLQYDERTFAGYRLLCEYFNYPDKFLFIEFAQLTSVCQRLSGNRLQIRCPLSAFPDNPRYQRLLADLGPQHFKLGCTPVINLFEHPSEPVRVSHQHSSYPVTSNMRQQGGFEIIKLLEVTRIEKGEDGESSDRVLPFYSIEHSVSDSPRFYWYSTREPSILPGNRCTDVEIALVDLDFKPMCPAREVLSIKMLCSNGDSPDYIAFGGSQGSQQTDFRLDGQALVQRVKLLRKPTESRRCPAKPGLQWRLISHLSLNYLSLVESGHLALQEMLTLYNISGSVSNRRQIQGIVAVDSAPGVCRVSGRTFSGFVRGTDIKLTLDEEAYVGASPYLFASVLERFFALYAAPNSFTRLTVFSAQQQQEIAQWPARDGTALVI